MRKLTLIFLFLMLAILVACQANDNGNESSSDNSEEQIQEENPHEGKSTMSVTDIEENELYRWEIEEDMAIVLVNKDGEIEENDAPSMIGEEGDRLFSGIAQLYLVYEGEDQGYLEDEVEIDYLNIDRLFAETYQFGETVFIDLNKPESSNIRSHKIWHFADEQLERVTFSDEEDLLISNNKLKFLDESYMQSYTYDNAGMGEHGVGWHFHTWEWDESEKNFTNIDHKAYTDAEDFGWELGEMIVEDWTKYEDYYVVFPSITLNEQDVTLIEEGSLIDESIKIGDSIDDLVERKSEQTEYIHEDYYNGSALYSFPEPFSYLYDEIERTIFGILFSGEALTNDLNSIYELFGEPVESQFSDMDNAYIDEFEIGDYLILMYYEEDEVQSLQLFKQNS